MDLLQTSSKQIIGGLWNRLAQDLGFRYPDAGKVMGLAGYGKYNYLQAHAMIEAYILNAQSQPPEFAYDVIKKVILEKILFSTLQQVTIDLIKKFIYPKTVITFVLQVVLHTTDI